MANFDINDPLAWVLELLVMYGATYVGSFTTHHWDEVTKSKFKRLTNNGDQVYENKVRNWLIASRILWWLTLVLVFLGAGFAFWIDWQASWVIITFFSLWFAGVLLEKWWPRWYFEVNGAPSWLAFVIFVVEWILIFVAWIILLHPGFGGLGRTPTGIFWTAFGLLVAFSIIQIGGFICLAIMRKRTKDVLEKQAGDTGGLPPPIEATSQFVDK